MKKKYLIFLTIVNKKSPIFNEVNPPCQTFLSNNLGSLQSGGSMSHEIILKYDENNNFTADIAGQYDVFAQFVFDNDSGYAKEKTSKVIIDFINSKIITNLKDKEKIFLNDICLAIGYVTWQNEEEFTEKYFESDEVFNSITRYDFRDELSRQSQFDEKFVIIPKDESIKISVYDCYINEEGILSKKNNLTEIITEPIILVETNAQSITPKYFVEYTYNGVTNTFSLSFSGEDGKLDINEYESEIVDISIYE